MDKTEHKFSCKEKVRIIPGFWNNRYPDDPSVVDEMYQYGGKIVTISYYSPKGYPIIEEDNGQYFWYEKWMEPAEVFETEASDISFLM